MRQTSKHLLGWTAVALPLAICFQTVSGQGFVDVAQEAGLTYVQAEQVYPPPPLINHLQTGGAAAADYDKDGWVDLLVTRMFAAPILYRNLGPDGEGKVRFEDVTEGTGLEIKTNFNGGPENFNGVAWADFNGDGHLDIYMTGFYSTRHYLFLNRGDNTFAELGSPRGASLPIEVTNVQTGEGLHHGFSVALGDYDNNGWIDIHTTDWQALSDSPTYHQHNVLLKNLGPNAPAFFRNVNQTAEVELEGFEESPNPPLRNKLGFSSSLVDLDNDGWQDLAVVADFKSAQLFWNDGDGTFTEGTKAAGVNEANFGMGSTFGDFDMDGDLDWFVTSRNDNRLYVNNGDRTFEELSVSYGVNDAGYGWGTAWLDFDNDGDLDLIMTNGHEDGYGEYGINEDIDRSTLWENRQGSFHDVSDNLGITDIKPGKGLVVFDYDNDGDLDVFIANTQSTPTLYRNELKNTNHWLRVNLVGRNSNTMGLGAKLYLRKTEESKAVYHQVIGGGNFLGQNEMTAHFGLGVGTSLVNSLEIHWPSGLVQTLQSINTNHEFTVKESPTKAQWLDDYFSESERLDPQFSGDDSDPDLDGINNFLEYALGLSPRVPTSNPMFVSVSKEQTETRFTYTRNADAMNLNYYYETSLDLTEWTAMEEQNLSTDIVEYIPGGREVVEVILDTPTDPIPFMRIRVETN